MLDGNFGVIAFLVLIAAFIIYIIAAAMRDKKRRQQAIEEPEPEKPPEPPVIPEKPLYCYACMAKRTGDEAFCPVCGSPATVQGKPGHLPAGTPLADRYTVGVSSSENRSCVTYLAVDRYLETKHLIREYFPKDLSARGPDGSEVVPSPGAEESFADGKKKFVREVRLLSRLNGCACAPGVTDLFYTNGTVYAVTDFAAGQPLTAYLTERGNFSPEFALSAFAPVIRQLEKEQSMGLIRCNLTPDSFTVYDGALKLEGIGSPGGNVATFLSPGYAPEELYRKSGAPGAWTDVYSLCAVIYRCVTGVAPDTASDRVYRDDLRAPSALGVYLSAAAEEALMKGLSVYREDRFPDCAALYAAVYASKSRPTGQEGFFEPIVDLPEEDPPMGNGGRFREPVDNDLF